MSKQATTTGKVDAKHLKCRTCRHPKSFHKSPDGCSAFGCSCKTKPGGRDAFEQITPKCS